MEKELSIIVDHVSHVYGDDAALSVKALDDVNIVIPHGQFIGLIGHTGSGKSTLVQHLNGLLKATSGHIYFNGRDIDDDDYNKKELRSKVGLVFQYPEHQLFEADVFPMSASDRRIWDSPRRMPSCVPMRRCGRWACRMSVFTSLPLIFREGRSGAWRLRACLP